jgi:glycosyltransferase involved in cell wall biosynthesis
MSRDLALSIVVPAYNEAPSLPVLIDEIVPVLDELGRSWEIVLVDDGSTDGTSDVVARLVRERPGVRGVLLRANCGKSAALMAGFAEATGDIVVTMDADLQDDPREIPVFVEKIESGFDLVSGWKKERHDPLERRLASRFFNAIVRKVAGVDLHDYNCGFKAYRSWCVRDLELRGNQHRFIPAILAWRGAKIGELVVRHRKRAFGASKYGFARYFHGAFDLATLILLTKFAQNPLYFFGLVGLPFIALGTLIGGYLLVNHILFLIFTTRGFQLTNRPLLIVAVFLFLMGLLMFLIGMLAELVLRSQTIGRGYWVKDVLRGEDGGTTMPVESAERRRAAR